MVVVQGEEDPYSLLPYSGDFREAGVIGETYALNQPMDALEVRRQTRTLPDSFSLVSCDKPNIIIETVKKAEEDEDMVVRMYEAFDRRTTAQITVEEGFKKAWLCDLMENKQIPLSLEDNTLSLSVSNFEIITLRFEK